MAALRDLIAEKSLAFRSAFIGRTLSAVTIGDEDAENPAPNAATEAVTDNFLKLTLDSAIPANRLVTAHVTALTPAGLRGSVAFIS
jgi:hypothetical protein